MSEAKSKSKRSGLAKVAIGVGVVFALGAIAMVVMRMVSSASSATTGALAATSSSPTTGAARADKADRPGDDALRRELEAKLGV